MKLVKTLGILLCFALLASTAVATTENKEMPTEKEEIEDEEKEDVKEDKHRITKKITSVLIRYNNGDITAEELGDRIDMILGEE